ncbi:MAG: hypothetical protein M1827_006050 [Pycnora praestabilis]|nr:MAG: hypothetical protein M1827_006050 [Pycnora praestabilis]
MSPQPATEILTLPLISRSELSDPSTDAGKVWQSTLSTVSQQDGYQRAYWGREIENPDVVQLLIDWDSVEDHQRFISSNPYAPFAKHLFTIADPARPHSLIHVNFTPHPPSRAVSSTSSPATEIATFYFPASVTAEEQKKYEDSYNRFTELLSKESDGFVAGSAGWSIEEVEHESVGEGNKAKVFVLTYGWKSVEAHMQFRETSTFKKNIGLLRDGPKGVEMHHVKFIEH